MDEGFVERVDQDTGPYLQSQWMTLAIIRLWVKPEWLD